MSTWPRKPQRPYLRVSVRDMPREMDHIPLATSSARIYLLTRKRCWNTPDENFVDFSVPANEIFASLLAVDRPSRQLWRWPSEFKVLVFKDPHISLRFDPPFIAKAAAKILCFSECLRRYHHSLCLCTWVQLASPQ